MRACREVGRRRLVHIPQVMIEAMAQRSCMIAFHTLLWSLDAVVRAAPTIACLMCCARGWSPGSQVHRITSVCAQDETSGPSLASRIGAYVNGFNTVLVLLWLVVGLLGFYISSVAIESEPFNPFTILGIPEDATPEVVNKAYKMLVLRWHPDKQKGEEAKRVAAPIFDAITKAKNALTDEVARENWLKHGHPDGPQVQKHSHRCLFHSISLRHGPSSVVAQ